MKNKRYWIVAIVALLVVCGLANTGNKTAPVNTPKATATATIEVTATSTPELTATTTATATSMPEPTATMLRVAPSYTGIVCKDGYHWPSTVRKGACHGHGGIR